MAVIGINAPSLSVSNLLTIASLSVSKTPAGRQILPAATNGAPEKIPQANPRAPGPQLIGYLLSHVCYNVFFHPLRKFPGPLWMGASRISYCYRLVTGRLPFDILELHRRYGEVVRIAPNELVFANAQAWKDIMGHRGPGEPEMEKAPQMYNTLKGRVYSPPCPGMIPVTCSWDVWTSRIC